MNELNLAHAKVTCNSGDPLRAAQLHNFALRLDLRRVRRDLVAPRKIAVVNRLLDVNAAVSRSLDWLNGRGDGTNEDLVTLEQLAIERGLVPDAVEAMAQ